MRLTEHPDAEGAKVTQKSQNLDNDFSRAVIGAAVEVQRAFGIGFLEAAYAAALATWLAAMALNHPREVPVTAR